MSAVISSIAILFAIGVKSAPVYFFNQGKNALKKQDYVKETSKNINTKIKINASI